MFKFIKDYKIKRAFLSGKAIRYRGMLAGDYYFIGRRSDYGLSSMVSNNYLIILNKDKEPYNICNLHQSNVSEILKSIKTHKSWRIVEKGQAMIQYRFISDTNSDKIVNHRVPPRKIMNSKGVVTGLKYSHLTITFPSEY